MFVLYGPFDKIKNLFNTQLIQVRYNFNGGMCTENVHNARLLLSILEIFSAQTCSIQGKLGYFGQGQGVGHDRAKTFFFQNVEDANTNIKNGRRRRC